MYSRLRKVEVRGGGRKTGEGRAGTEKRGRGAGLTSAE